MSLMSCLEKLFTLSHLVPTPAVAPAFMLLFGISLYYSVKPCGYCLGLMTILYLCFNPSSPFVTTPPASHSNTTGTAAAVYSLTDPLPDRGWFNWNGGRVFDPPLVGYQPVPASSSSSTSSSPSYSSSASSGTGTDASVLPQGYVDLTYKGLGFVLDLGWRRTEEGMRWEGNVGEYVAKKPEVPVDEAGRGEDGGSESTTVHIEGEGADGVRAALASLDDEAMKKGVEINVGRGRRWSVSFLGDL